MEPVIEFLNIQKSFGQHKVLKSVSFPIYENEIIGLVGKSGGGKTTLLRLLMGFYNSDKGKIYYEGKDVSKNLHHLRSNIGFTTQESSFYSKLTVKENLLYFGQMYDISKKDLLSRIPSILGLMKLAKNIDDRAENLSGGMKRRLDFAISLVHDPKVLILDEPTTGLDPILRDEIWQIIWNIREYGKTIIVSTHFFNELEKHCHRIAILHEGKIISVQSPDWYSTNYFPSFEKTFAYFLECVKKKQVVVTGVNK